MLISMNWVQDFVDLAGIEPQLLAERFTLSTAEIEELVITHQHLKKIKVVEVVEIEKHPQADKLKLVSFTDGKEIKKVVCGAPNVVMGMKTAFAPLGTTFPDGFTLEPKKIRGVLSEGMLCSESELGLSELSDGIINLPSEANLGLSLLDHLDLVQDSILDIDNKSLTHRPDLWSHYGIAREFSAIFQTPLKETFSSKREQELRELILSNGAKSPIEIEVSSDSACTFYFGLSLDNVEVKESPQWLKSRLSSVGLTPKNNLVDISNYVMLEYGYPLHIFDRSKINGDKLFIRRVRSSQKFTTLDGKDYQIESPDTVIEDDQKGLVLGGIMGGLDSSVQADTSSVFIEVANWKASEVRKTSTRLGLRTDSSLRFEKSLDDHAGEKVLLRTLDLILQSCPKAQVKGSIEKSGKISSPSHLLISTSQYKINKVLGLELSLETIINIFKSLDFTIEKSSEGDKELVVRVPSFRVSKDIEGEADLIEEIGRIVGYATIIPKAPSVPLEPMQLPLNRKVHRVLRSFLPAYSRAHEIYTYPFWGEKLVGQANWPIGQLKLINALSVDHQFMRNSLIPHFLEASALNAKNNKAFRFFEIGKVYLNADSQNKSGDKSDNKSDKKLLKKDASCENVYFSSEKNILGICFYSKSSNQFSSLLDTCEASLTKLGLSFQLDYSQAQKGPASSLVSRDWDGLHPHEYLDFRVMGKKTGVLFSLHPLLLKNFKIKGHLSMAFFDLSQAEQFGLKDKHKFTSLNLLPPSEFDFTLVVDKNYFVQDIIKHASKLKIKGLESLLLVDVYDLNESQKTVTLRAKFIDKEKTLSSDELDQLRKSLLDGLEKKGLLLKSI